MRKDVKTKTQTKTARETMLNKMLANSDGQSVDTMMQYYVVRTPETDAEMTPLPYDGGDDHGDWREELRVFRAEARPDDIDWEE